jgi:hypothetical protein
MYQYDTLELRPLNWDAAVRRMITQLHNFIEILFYTVRKILQLAKQIISHHDYIKT